MRKIIWGVTTAVLMAMGTAHAAEWYENTKVKGDVRFRLERVDEDGKDNRDRARVRARLGAYTKVNDEVDVGIGLATGSSSDPVSRNQTLTGGFGPKDFLLDLAYVDYHPEMIKGLNLIGGKMKNPFIAVTDYIWDGDLTPEGAALKYKLGTEVQFLANAGAFWLEERSSDDEAMLYGAQAGLKMSPADKVTVLAGVSYYKFEHLEDYPLIDGSGKMSSFGNSKKSVVDSAGKTNFLYATEYGSIEPFVQLDFDLGVPVSLFGTFVSNQDADSDNKGYSFGGKLGKAKDPNTFELAYDYRRLEKDAWVGALADSDSWNGGTDGKGHKVSFKYQLQKNWQAGVTYFMDKKGLDKEVDYKRIQLDLVASF